MASTSLKSIYHKFIPFIILFVACLVWSNQPVPLEYLKPENEQSNLPPTVIIGAQSHLLPFLRVINFLGHPFRRAVIPLNIQDMKANAISSLSQTMKRPAPYQHGDDFGDFMDMEVAEEMIRVCEEKCHFVGRLIITISIQHILRQNLHLTNMLRSYPEIEAQEIVKPVFLLASMRTGSTFLYQVLSDVFEQELGHIKTYETIGGAVEVHYPPKRYDNALESLKHLHSMVSTLKILHEYTTPDDPEDHSGWYLNSMRGVGSAFMITSQKLIDMTFKATDSPLYNHRFLEANLKLKQWEEGKGTQRFLLKAPESLLGFSDLANRFPDAKFVTVSRDEIAMYRSTLALTYEHQQMVIKPSIEDAILFTDELLCAQMKALEEAHGGKHDVMRATFQSVFKDTLSLIADFAKHTNLPWDDVRQAHARAVIERRLSWKKMKVQYNMHEFLEEISMSDSKEKEMLKIALHLEETCR